MLFAHARQSLAARFVALNQKWIRLKQIHQKRMERVSWLGNELFKMAMLHPQEKDRWQEARLALAFYTLKPIEKYSLWRLKRATKHRDAVLHQLQALQDLHSEIKDVGLFLGTIGVPPQEYQPGDTLPLIDPDKVLSGEFTLDFFIRHAAHETLPQPQFVGPRPKTLNASA